MATARRDRQRHTAGGSPVPPLAAACERLHSPTAIKRVFRPYKVICQPQFPPHGNCWRRVANPAGGHASSVPSPSGLRTPSAIRFHAKQPLTTRKPRVQRAHSASAYLTPANNCVQAPVVINQLFCAALITARAPARTISTIRLSPPRANAAAQCDHQTHRAQIYPPAGARSRSNTPQGDLQSARPPGILVT